MKANLESSVPSFLFHYENGKLKHGPHGGLWGSSIESGALVGDCTRIEGECNIWGDCSGVSGDIELLDGDCSLIFGDCSGICGSVEDIEGDVSDLTGDVSGLAGDISALCGFCAGAWGNATGFCGDLDGCEITKEERKAGVAIDTLVNKNKSALSRRAMAGDSQIF